MEKPNIVLKEESYRIIGACFEVYREKGSGFLESVYQECLALEFEKQGIPYEEKPRLRLEYKGQPLKQEYQPDFLCFGEIIVEIKADNMVDDAVVRSKQDYATQLAAGSGFTYRMIAGSKAKDGLSAA